MTPLCKIQSAGRRLHLLINSLPKGSMMLFSLIAILLGTGIADGETGRTNPSESQTTPSPSLWSHYSLFTVVRSLAFEGDVLWVGTHNGLLRYDTVHEEQKVYTTKDGLLSNIIHSVVVDPKGNKWVGTYGGGLNRFDGKSWKVFTPYGNGSTVTYGTAWAGYQRGKGLADLWVYGVLFDPKGTMWVATWKGVSRFDGKGFKTYTTDDGLIDKWVYTLSRDRKGAFWFGTEGGVTRFDGKRWKSWTHKDGIGADPGKVRPPEADSLQYIPKHHQEGAKPLEYNPNYVVSSAVDRQNRIWVGTLGGGISRYDGKRWTTFTTQEGLAGNVVNALAVDSKGILWIGTDQGISRYDGKGFKNFTERDGIGSTYAIAIDRHGHKWFGTFGGINEYAGE
jgi:ligand-binding sensor domain-containing protein